MSFHAVAWAVRQKVHPSSLKFVLFCFAECASNETAMCYPSVAYVCEFTAQDRKTVLSNIAKLIDLGYLEDTGKRAGRTQQVIVYRLKSPEIGTVQTVPKTEPFVHPNSPVFPLKQSRFSVETVPKTGHGTYQEPIKEPETEIGARTARTQPRKRAPKDFVVTDEMRAWARNKAPGVDLEAETEAFRDHEYRSGKTDWIAAWRSWIRKSKPANRSQSADGGWKPPPDEPGFTIR